MDSIATFGTVAMDTREPRTLAAFYGAILGWEIDEGGSDESWVKLTSPVGATIAFQHAPDHVAPTWPSDTDHLQAHLDFYVDDLDATEAQVLALGARKVDHQPDPDSFRVFLDLSGHPFCLCDE